MTNKKLYQELQQIEYANTGSNEDFERMTRILDQIDDNDIIGTDGNTPLGKMHPYHTGTIPTKKFYELYFSSK